MRILEIPVEDYNNQDQLPNNPLDTYRVIWEDGFENKTLLEGLILQINNDVIDTANCYLYLDKTENDNK